MVFNNFLFQTFLNILYFNLCGQYMPMAVWIRDILEPYVLPCNILDHHVLPCYILDPHVRACNILDPHVRSCNILDHHVRSCNILDPHTRSCNILDPHTRSCNILDPHARSCNILDLMSAEESEAAKKAAGEDLASYEPVVLLLGTPESEKVTKKLGFGFVSPSKSLA